MVRARCIQALLFTQEGIETLRSTLDAKKEVYGELSSSVAETWKLIGNVHLAQQSMEKALRALKKVHMLPSTYCLSLIGQSALWARVI